MNIINPVIALDCTFAHSLGGRKLLATGTMIVNDRLNTANMAKIYATMMRGAPRSLCSIRIAERYVRMIAPTPALPCSSDEFFFCLFFFIDDKFLAQISGHRNIPPASDLATGGQGAFTKIRVLPKINQVGAGYPAHHAQSFCSHHRSH